MPGRPAAHRARRARRAEAPGGRRLTAFQLTIDTRTGQITTAAPSASASSRGPRAVGAVRPSFSLVGSEAVALHASNCAFTVVPNNSRQKRCTFTLAIENRLGGTDLVTATTFPRLPAGTSGIVAFPFTAAALGVPGGSATPSPDWNGGLINFFNDFGGCSSKTNDCYRSEVYPGALYAGETTDARPVGFDVDNNAQSVSSYVVVAADLRDNPPTTLRLAADGLNCGTAYEDNKDFDTGPLRVTTDFDGFINRGLCGFSGLPIPTGTVLVSATLQAYQESGGGAAFTEFGGVAVDHVDFSRDIIGPLLPETALAANTGTLSADAVLEYKSLDVTTAVKDDIDSGRSDAQFRLRFRLAGSTSSTVTFSGTSSPNPPELVLVYRNP